MTTEFAQQAAQRIMQEFSYELGDAINKFPAETHVFLVAVMRSVAATIEAQFDETDRLLLPVLLESTNCVVMPTAFDPRRKAHE